MQNVLRFYMSSRSSKPVRFIQLVCNFTIFVNVTLFFINVLNPLLGTLLQNIFIIHLHRCQHLPSVNICPVSIFAQCQHLPMEKQESSQ